MREIIKTMIELLYLPARTLEGLEVGDWVEVSFYDENDVYITTSGTVFEVVHLQNGYKWFRVGLKLVLMMLTTSKSSHVRGLNY